MNVFRHMLRASLKDEKRPGCTGLNKNIPVTVASVSPACTSKLPTFAVI